MGSKNGGGVLRTLNYGVRFSDLHLEWAALLASRSTTFTHQVSMRLRAVVRGSERSKGKRMQLSERSALATTCRAVAMRSAGPRALLLAGIAAIGMGGALPAGAADQSFEIYGFAMADFIQDSKRVDPAWQDAFRPSKIADPEGQFGTNGQSSISAKQSRFGFKGTLPTGDSTPPVNFKFEIDMFGVGVDAGQTTIRLRHARMASGVKYSPAKRTACSWTSMYSRTSSTTGVRAA